MKVEFLRSFDKDLKTLDLNTKKKVLSVILEFEKARDLRDIKDVKKLVGHTRAYRLRIGRYRLGFFSTGDAVELARLVDRKDIYKLFP